MIKPKAAVINRITIITIFLWFFRKLNIFLKNNKRKPRKPNKNAINQAPKLATVNPLPGSIFQGHCKNSAYGSYAKFERKFNHAPWEGNDLIWVPGMQHPVMGLPHSLSLVRNDPAPRLL